MKSISTALRSALPPFLLALVILPLGAGEPRPKRRVFVLHSGIHTILANPSINIGAERLAEGLKRRGVRGEDVVVLSNPFPKASWKSMFPREAVVMYFDSLTPTSKVAQDAYIRMDRALKDAKVGPDDEIIWVGHSAGGQLGMTVAHLATSLDKYPDLARTVRPYRVSMVVTLGTPIGANLMPESVRLRNYFSPDDNVVQMATKSTWFMSTAFGFKGKISPCSDVLCRTWEARVFHDIEHNEWTKEDRILDRIYAELQGEYRPAWHSALCPRPGLCLSQMLAHVLSQECHISLEDPPKVKK
ncbi:MAG: hypothetical protein U0793_05120 [Gemmataceae bacterium]|mgnify:CR=1 FL=1